MRVRATTIRYLLIISLMFTLSAHSLYASRAHHRSAKEIKTAAPISKKHARSEAIHDRIAQAKTRKAAAKRERLATAKHEAKLAKMARAEAHRKLSAHAERMASIHDARLAKLARAESHGRLSAHATRLAALDAVHLARLAKAEMNSPRSARAKKLASSHEAHFAKIARFKAISGHAARLAVIAAQQHLRELRLAKLESNVAAEHAKRMAQIAEAEAEREKHKDKPSDAVNIAANSKLPIWQGDAYAAQVPVKLVTVNMNDPRVRVSALLARNGIGTAEPFSQMIDRAHPSVAVTGTFFSLDNLRPVGDIVVNGSLAYFGGMGTALAIRPDNHADMITVPWGHHHDWSGYDTVVACGPRLLEDRQIVLDPRMEHFKDKHMLSPNSRIAVGITGHNQLVFCMTREPIYLGRLAKIMKSIGCKEAMNLDAGTSTGFYCNGRMMARPGRWLTNAIVVYSNRKPSDPEQEEASALPVHPMTTTHLASYRR